jgi:hypothetical protein
MIVFVDDSGDPGFKLEKGSSLIFVISCVIFDDELDAEKTAVAIKELKRKLKFPDNMEFKFNKSSKSVRIKFLEHIKNFKFQVRSLVIEKEIVRSKELKRNKNSFYSYAIKTLLQHSHGSILDARIRIDGSGDRVFRRNFITYLRKQLNSNQRRIMKDCKLIDSKDNVLIQLADMLAGAIYRSYQKDKTDHLIYKRIIHKHIEDEWKFK